MFFESTQSTKQNIQNFSTVEVSSLNYEELKPYIEQGSQSEDKVMITEGLVNILDSLHKLISDLVTYYMHTFPVDHSNSSCFTEARITSIVNEMIKGLCKEL